MSAVRFENISKRYKLPGGDVHAVQNVSLEVQAEEFLVLVGPSGSGKTTLLRLLAGLDTPSEGKLFLQDKDASTVPPQSRQVAMVFQHPTLFPHLNVSENIGFSLRIRKAPPAAIDAAVAEVAAMVGVTSLLARRPEELSGGEQQRVALARALAQKPKVILFDEPLSNLDLASRVRVRSELKELHRVTKQTFVYVTHDQAEAMVLGDRIAVLNAGHLQQVGTPKTIYDSPANLCVAKFIGSPEINCIPGTMQNGKVRFTFNYELPARISRVPEQSQNVIVGVRPEDVLIGLSANGGAEGVVTLVDNLGWERHVYLTCGDQRIVARVTNGPEFVVGDKVSIQFRPEKTLIFDSQTHDLVT